MVINNKIILLTAREVCTRVFSVFFEYFLSFPLAACGAEGASQLPHRWLRRRPLGRQGMTSHLLIDIPCLGLACSLNTNHRGKVIPSCSRWSRAKASNYPPPPPTEPTQVFNEKKSWTINKSVFLWLTPLGTILWRRVADVHLRLQSLYVK